MPTSGSGTMTLLPAGGAVAPFPTAPLSYPASCVSLNRYAQITHLNECAFWGINNPDDPETNCRTIWTEWQREDLARYLAEAQEEIEQQVGFTLCPTWFSDEHHPYRRPILTNWGKVIAGGVRGETVIQSGAAVVYATEPATVGPIVTTVTDANEIRVYYPGSDREIEPKYIDLSGGNVTLYIPRCRLVANPDNPEDGWDYSDLSNFLATVDVKRVYNDPSINAVLVWPHKCSAVCAQSGCSEYTHAGCEYVRLPEIGSMDVTPASYSGGQWVTSNGLGCCRGTPQFVRLNYYAGQQQITRQMEDAIVRLAHSKMPDEFCGCEVWTRLWRRDRFVPEVLTRERLNNPFGLSDGSWIAFTFTRQFRLVRGDAL